MQQSHSTRNKDQIEEKEEDQDSQSEQQKRLALIEYQIQFVYRTCGQNQEQLQKSQEKRNKNFQFEGGLLFPGRKGNQKMKIAQLIENSKYKNLKTLFSLPSNAQKSLLNMKELVRFVLQIKHSTIMIQIFEIYDFIIGCINELKFEEISGVEDRHKLIKQIASKVVRFVEDCRQLFVNFTEFMHLSPRNTIQLIEVTTYCFLAERFDIKMKQFYKIYNYESLEVPVSKRNKPVE